MSVKRIKTKIIQNENILLPDPVYLFDITSIRLGKFELGKKLTAVKVQYLESMQAALITQGRGKKASGKKTSFDHLSVARKTIEDYGLPLAYYVDQHSIFRFVKHRGIHVSYTVGEDEGKIQFKRALEILGIGVIYAHSPEAKER